MDTQTYVYTHTTARAREMRMDEYVCVERREVVSSWTIIGDSSGEMDSPLARRTGPEGRKRLAAQLEPVHGLARCGRSPTIFTGVCKICEDAATPLE